MQTGRKEGMQVADKIMLDLVAKKEIDGEVAWEFAADKNMFANWAPKNNFLPPETTGTHQAPPGTNGAGAGHSRARFLARLPRLRTQESGLKRVDRVHDGAAARDSPVDVDVEKPRRVLGLAVCTLLERGSGVVGHDLANERREPRMPQAQTLAG